MRAQEFVAENWGVSKEPIPLPIGDYLGPESDEFAPPGNYQDVGILHDEVADLIDAGVDPQVVNIDPQTVLATQDWLSNAGGDDPLFDEYPDRPVIYQKAGKLYILDGHHRTTRAWKEGRPIGVYLFSDQQATQLDEDIYNILKPHDCGPFDGGCVLVAQALQQIHGGRVVVLVDADDRAQHAAVYANGQLIDYDGAADPKEFVQQFEQNERANIQGIRAIRDTDLPDAPRDAKLIPQIVQALSENFADGKVKGKSRPGRVKRAGASCNGSVTDLRARAKKASGEKAKMYHWCANMKSGRNKNK